MPNTTIQLKKSSTPSAKPANLANGELAINFADGKLYYKNTTSSIVEITPTQSSSFGTVSANGVLLVADTVGDVLTIASGNNINIATDAVNDRLTIGVIDNPIFNNNVTADKFLSSNNGQGENFRVGDDAWIGDTNLANVLRIKGQQDPTQGYILFGSNDGKTLGRSGTGPLTWDANVSVGNITASNTVTGQYLRSTNSNGDEGGEIILSTAQTNNGLSTSVTIDIFRNQIRFFETGGTNRGAFINLALATAGVGSDILSPAGSTDTTARTIASQAFDKANAANVLAFNTGIGANAFASATIAGANTSVGTGANAFTSATIAGANTAVGTGANNFLLAVIAGANSAVGTGANNFMIAVQNGSNTAIGGGANAFASATIAGANTAVGTGANSFASATIAGANTAVGTGANNFASATIAGANSAVGTGANNFMIAVQNGSNTAVGTGANAFTSATIAGANTAVGTGANAFSSATISGANTFLISIIAGANTAVGSGANNFLLAVISGANTAVGNGANNFMIAVQNGSNTAVGTGANAFTSATIAGANTAVGTGANAFASATIAGANTAVGTGANAFTSATIAGANSAVGTGANNFMIAVQNGSNTAVGGGANAFAVATFGAANTRPVGNTLSSTYTVRSTRRSLNFIPGSNITINVDDDSAGDRSNVTIAATGGLTAFSTKTANYTAVNGDRLLCNTTAGTFIVTLPATPTSGATILIYDIGNFTANPLTVARNSSTIEFIADDFSLDIGQTRNEFVYDGSTWHVYSSIGPRGLADTTTVASSIAYSIALG